MTESSVNAETSSKVETPASSRVLEKAWDRAKPVLQTAAGGALITASAFLSSALLQNIDNNFMGSWAISGGLLANLGVSTAILGAAGGSLMKEPVKKAFEYFKSRPWEHK